jgi:hypothetical protein
MPELTDVAAALGQKSIPVFLFHECAAGIPATMQSAPIFKSVADLSRGIYTRFNGSSAAALKEMLSSIAAFSTAGIRGVERLALPATTEARQLRSNLRLMLGSGTGGKRN